MIVTKFNAFVQGFTCFKNRAFYKITWNVANHNHLTHNTVPTLCARETMYFTKTKSIQKKKYHLQ